MTSQDVIMPKIGMYMEDIQLVEWHFGEGAEVAPGDVLFTLETDKITTDVEAEFAGLLHRIVEAGSMVSIGGVVGAIAPSREEYEALLSVAPAPPPTAEGGAGFEPAQSELFLSYVRATDEAFGGTPAVAGAEAVSETAARAPARRPGRVSPRARALIKRAGLAPEIVEAIPATGPDQRLTDRDVQAFLDSQASAPAVRRPAAVPLVEIAVAERRPLTGRRGVIARRMMESLQTTAQLTSILEIDVTELVEWRQGSEPQPGYTAIFVALVGQALRRHPLVNSRVAGDEIEVLADVNVGFAVHTDDGVIVPVVIGADGLGVPEIDAQVVALTERARAGTIALTELDGATFTLSNSGAAAVDITTAIINPPQAAILWLGRIRERPVAVDGGVVVRPTVQACITYDHRVIDGVPAAEFLGTLEEFVRTVPDSLPLR